MEVAGGLQKYIEANLERLKLAYGQRDNSNSDSFPRSASSSSALLTGRLPPRTSSTFTPTTKKHIERFTMGRSAEGGYGAPHGISEGGVEV